MQSTGQMEEEGRDAEGRPGECALASSQGERGFRRGFRKNNG